MSAVARLFIIKFTFGIVLSIALAGASLPSLAGTIVRVSTSIGDFSMELLDDTAPITVQNFLNYVNRNDYNGTYIHRAVDNFVVQGGAFRFEPFQGPIAVPTDPPIVNEFNVSNTRGTVAMAKISGAEDSATNQWFVNLADNLSLDTTDGGFTVFAQVLGEGMQILDAINALPTVSLGDAASDAPFITPSYSSPLDFVYLNIEVTDRFSAAAHVIESTTGLLITAVDINGGSDFVSMNFNLVPSEPEVTIEANLESIIPIRESFPGIATFSTTDNRFRIPSLEVNLAGTVSVVTNVVFVLSDAVLGRFTLESFDL
ncbi:MAG: peptidylprolyl isomerase [Proteobacteria bacterium]|nr:peptidylprolyl isomerase [Pseudomonadota bacterium]